MTPLLLGPDNMIRIRPASVSDLSGIHGVIHAAFSNEESALIAPMVTHLLADQTVPPVLSWVAETDQQIVGYVGFSPAHFESADAGSAYILAPLAVLPECQKQGIGSRLVNAGVENLKDRDVDAWMVYGDPDYYGRFGVTDTVGAFFVPPYPLEYPFGWQAVMLSARPVPSKPIQFSCVEALSAPELW